MQKVEEMLTPALVREFVEIKMSDARGDIITNKRHARLIAVVGELRIRRILD